MQGRVPLVVTLSKVFFDSFGRPYPLVPLNAAPRASGGREGKGLYNDRAWMRNAQFDLCDVGGCCCDAIDRMLPGYRASSSISAVRPLRGADRPYSCTMTSHITTPEILPRFFAF
jgi:hypothetical protein